MLSIIFNNLIPLAGAIFLGWSPAELILFYAYERLVALVLDSIKVGGLAILTTPLRLVGVGILFATGMSLYGDEPSAGVAALVAYTQDARWTLAGMVLVSLINFWWSSRRQRALDPIQRHRAESREENRQLILSATAYVLMPLVMMVAQIIDENPVSTLVFIMATKIASDLAEHFKFFESRAVTLTPLTKDALSIGVGLNFNRRMTNQYRRLAGDYNLTIKARRFLGFYGGIVMEGMVAGRRVEIGMTHISISLAVPNLATGEIVEKTTLSPSAKLRSEAARSVTEFQKVFVITGAVNEIVSLLNDDEVRTGLAAGISWTYRLQADRLTHAGHRTVGDKTYRGGALFGPADYLKARAVIDASLRLAAMLERRAKPVGLANPYG
jgi:hypothetical protein